MENVWFESAMWMGLAFVASLISIRLGISVALVEILVGVAAGNLLPIDAGAEWIGFLAMMGGVVLTFLAGAEIDPVSLRENLRASLWIGIPSFLLPFLACWGFAEWALGWRRPEAQIAGIALSTTSVAVVYAVMIETGLNRTAMGKTILAACFITDLGTVLALGLIFAQVNRWLIVFGVVTALVLWAMPRMTSRLIARFGATRVSEPEVKFIFAVLFALAALATRAKSEAVLPAYLLGLVLGGVFMHDKVLVHRMRSLAFAMFTPFYFLRAGMRISIPAVGAALGTIAAFLGMKMIGKAVGVWPACRAFWMRRNEASYTTLLMSTGLTFGTISALFGLENGIIDRRQYSILVTAVILSALVPTMLAERLFKPAARTMDAWGRFYRRQIRERR